jgi:hypothetical protein
MHCDCDAAGKFIIFAELISHEDLGRLEHAPQAWISAGETETPTPLHKMLRQELVPA